MSERIFSAVAGLAILILVLIVCATAGGLLNKLMHWAFS